MIFLDTQIRSSLGLEFANTDACLEAMDELMELEIGPLMLKKHCHIVETFKRVKILNLQYFLIFFLFFFYFL